MNIFYIILLCFNFFFFIVTKNKLRWLHFVGIICLLLSFNITFTIHSWYWLLRKTGIRKPAQIQSIEYLGNGQFEIKIDKLDPGEKITFEIPIENKEVKKYGTEI